MRGVFFSIVYLMDENAAAPYQFISVILFFLKFIKEDVFRYTRCVEAHAVRRKKKKKNKKKTNKQTNIKKKEKKIPQTNQPVGHLLCTMPP